ncbi:beta-propeller fold lactonase family protein, partial [Acinetobacter guerrae]|uniref:beta-propeller fold lactonase family protein n=1 Tax=Acinetobacter guerrae TaxID=1843371 RepID=UPI00125EE5C6
MGRLLGLAALALLTGCTLRPPAPLQLVVGCSGPTCPGLLRYAFDPQSGRLEASPAQRLLLANATWLVVDPGRPLLFAVDEQPQGRVSSLGIGAATVHAVEHRQLAPGADAHLRQP